MKHNWLVGIRVKLILLCFSSLLLTVLTLYIMRTLTRMVASRYLRAFAPFVRLLWRMNERAGFAVLPALLVVCLFVVYILLLSHRSVLYLRQITATVQQIADTDFHDKLPVRSMDELGQLADRINNMSRQLQASQAKERMATQLKNELVTNVSHDLRTPLTSIIGYLRMIESDRYKDEVELRYYTSIAYEKAQSLGRMVNDLFEYTKMTYGQVALNRSEIDLVALIGQLAADFTMQLAESAMAIQMQSVVERLPIYADGDKLMRVFENLISNAIKYGQQGGTIEVYLHANPKEAIVQVKNHGIPIPDTDLPHIFERFYRVEKSRSQETGGSGLGLAIVKSLVELHHGSIAVMSNVDETSFEVRIPRISS